MHDRPAPIGIDGFDHPHALTGLPVRRRPDHGASPCTVCSGRGARNEILDPVSFRCRIAGCDACGGSGWTAVDGALRRWTTVLVDGSPAWTVEILRIGTVVPMHERPPVPVHPAADRAIAA